MTDETKAEDHRFLALWVTIMALVSVLAGAMIGLLAWAGGMVPPTAVITGCGAFVIAMTLGLAVINTLWKRR
ncbi:hypothetical protein AB0383_48480 [Amycolatopsis sp. NPDC051373]|uniref:hypothetical protein n=1 Tax=Amycolatopsis sp. NPDC051373 TaxID=3155801 RepID=UPI00344B2888